MEDPGFIPHWLVIENGYSVAASEESTLCKESGHPRPPLQAATIVSDH